MDKDSQRSKGDEIRVFLFTTVIGAPVVTIATVAIYGFAVWFSQMFMGPPGS